MKEIILITLFLAFSACRESTVTPISGSQDIRNKIKKTYTIRYPLMPDDIGEYSYGDVIGMNPKRNNILQHITKPLKEMVYDMGVTLFRRNKVRAQGTFSVPKEAFEHLKSVKLKRVFFVLDTCTDKSHSCANTVRGIKATFIRDLFINLEPLTPGSLVEDIKEIDEQTFFQEAKEFVRNFGKSKRVNNSNNFQLASYSRKKRIGNAKLNNMFVFKQKKGLNRLQEYLKNSEYVKNTVLFGDLILAELHDLPNHDITRLIYTDQFRREFKSQYKYIKPVSCKVGNCTELEINSDNLIDYFKENPDVIINTFIKIKNLPSKDFQYKGFIEFDVELNI